MGFLGISGGDTSRIFMEISLGMGKPCHRHYVWNKIFVNLISINPSSLKRVCGVNLGAVSYTYPLVNIQKTMEHHHF